MAARPNAPAVVVLAPGDNVGIAGRALGAGDALRMGQVRLAALTAVPLGHKIALTDIAAGAKVFRCGVPIGSATRPIKAGEHVHTQNLASDYLPAFTLDVPAAERGR
ncbi:MAG: UxaA family hydrolase [Burkholderiales bacterium]|nr:UxaA family hydrolase [Burkholderiales bacterium]